MSAIKLTKDKPLGAPRIVPRPTAASAARAARNASNASRNLANNKQSPTRSPQPTSAKVQNKHPIIRASTIPQSDSKTDCKPSPKVDPEAKLCENESVIIEEPTQYTDFSKTEQLISESNLCEITQLEQNLNLAAKEDVIHIVESECKTRSHTPSVSSSPSRPRTPRSAQSSRPQTPCVSRPMTPLLKTSRPTTPRLQAPRPKTPTTTPNSSPSPVQDSHIVFENEDAKTAYYIKQQEVQLMKKEAESKQTLQLDALELFNCLRGIQHRMSQEGGSGGGEGEQQHGVVLYNVADWSEEDVAQICRITDNLCDVESAAELVNTILPIEEGTLEEFYDKIMNMPAYFANFCIHAFTERQEVLDWVKDLIDQHENGSGESMSRLTNYNKQGLQFCDDLREVKSRADEAVNKLTQLSKRAYRERTTLIAVGQSLVREIARIREEINTVKASPTVTDNEISRLLESTRRELQEEKSARNTLKEKLANTEVQLRQSRNRVAKMDKQLREAEASITNLTGTVKSLEDQSRQREVQLEARARKLRETVKTGEVASVQLVQQRDLLQAEVSSLKTQIEDLMTQHAVQIDELNEQFDEIKQSLEQEKQNTEMEIKLKEFADNALVESRATIEQLKIKITELENSRINPELPTEREMDLWAELQATKETLRVAEDEITTSKREKVRFLETLTKITDNENKVEMQQKLAAEVLSKEKLVGKMQTQIRELTKNIKLNEQKVIQYEQYVRNLQAHNRAVANCQESPNGISYQDLQQEIMTLRMNLLEAVHRNEEISEILSQKEQQLEQQEKTSRAQARVIKVREELINMLKNKETEQSRELSALQQDLEHRMKIVDEVNKQIAAKAEEIQELFTTLENKQQQIHRLEKIVLALEEQQKRAQAQRTRHEEKIASLEHEIAANYNKRDRKFLFF